MSEETLGRKRKGPLDDITGKKYGHLLVVRMEQDLARYPKGTYLAVCKCTLCGREDYKTIPNPLKQNRVTSCGCRRDQYKDMTGEKNKQFTGYKEIRGKAWSKLQRRARLKGYVWDLSIEDAWDLYEKQGRCCALTGLPLDFAKSSANTTASLDRINCSGGYELTNVQWVHKDVNIMRNVYSLEYFFRMCGLVAKKAKERAA